MFVSKIFLPTGSIKYNIHDCSTWSIHTGQSTYISNRGVSVYKYSDEIVIINDNEKSKAGEEGAIKTAKVLFDAGRNVKIAFPPRPEDVEKVDVDDYLTEHNNSPEAVEEILDKSKYYIDYRIDDLTLGDFDGIIEILNEVKGKDYMVIDYALNKLEKNACLSKEVLLRKFEELGGEDPISS